MDAEELSRRTGDLALRVTDLARRELLQQNYFLAPALEGLQTRLRQQSCPYATDGTTLFVGADVVVEEFRRTRKAPVHDLAHVLVHCLLLHPFVQPSRVDAATWELACDIEAERMARDLCGPREDARGQALHVVEQKLHGRLGDSVGTQSIYRSLMAGDFARERSAWAQAFRVDDCDDWFCAPVRRRGSASPVSSPDASTRVHEGSSGRGAGASGTLRRARGSQDPEGVQGQRDPTHRTDDGSSEGSRQQGGPQGQAGSRVHENSREQADSRGQSGSQTPKDATPADAGPLETQRQERVRGHWEGVARGVRMELQTRGTPQAQALGQLVDELGRAGQPHHDLSRFLRLFAVPHEQLRVSPDEFDYVYYAYGLSLYGNMPLIEQLEYREAHLVRDFVVVLDTSGSVRGDVVKSFVAEAFGVLSAQDRYCDRVNVHVIQCDAAVRSDDKLTCAADLARWKERVVLHGFGGTDFRPAFRYVDQLVRQGEFDELVGLLYFTDGQGVYPERPPAYKVAFVFCDDGYRREEVPPWALQVVLSQTDLQRGLA
ncbi:MAG: VWA-like domain-containing protein [Atopobiaceae bacterium]